MVSEPNRNGEGVEGDPIGSFSYHQGCAVGLLAVATMLLLDSVGGEGRANAAGSSIIAIVSAIVIFKSLRHRAWFWVAITLMAFLHIAGVFLIPWPDGHLYGVELYALMAVDAAAVIGMIWLLHRVVEE